MLPEIGHDGQQKLLKSRVLVLGGGALGSVAAVLLARAGAGHLKVVDRDIVERSNLHRQMFFEADIDKPKAEALAAHIAAANPEIDVEALSTDFNSSNAETLVRSVDVVLEGTDNLETRYLLNDAAFKNSVPWVYSGAVGSQGMLSYFSPPSPCFRCIFREPPPPGALDTCETAGVLNTATTSVASFAVALALKSLLGKGKKGELTILDGWGLETRRISFAAREDCPCCGKGEFEFLRQEGKLYLSLCGRDAVHVSPKKKGSLDIEGLAAKLEPQGTVKVVGGTCVLDTGEFNIIIFRDGRAIVRGVDDVSKARALYSRYVGD
jgi:adenylyltransferase/sulfurtransferase